MLHYYRAQAVVNLKANIMRRTSYVPPYNASCLVLFGFDQIHIYICSVRGALLEHSNL